MTEVSPCDNEFISTVFLVPKKTGDFRPVINLKPLNQFFEKIHFKMENIRMALNCISSGDFMVSIDLACVASVSRQITTRKFKSGSKNNMEGGEERRRGNACSQTPRFWKKPLDISRFGSFEIDSLSR